MSTRNQRVKIRDLDERKETFWTDDFSGFCLYDDEVMDSATIAFDLRQYGLSGCEIGKKGEMHIHSVDHAVAGVFPSNA